MIQLPKWIIVAWQRTTHAASGALSIGASLAAVGNVTRVHPDHISLGLEMGVVLFGFLMHRHLSMVDVRRVVEATFRREWQTEISVFQRIVDEAIRSHEKRTGEVK